MMRDLETYVNWKFSILTVGEDVLSIYTQLPKFQKEV